MHFAKQTISAGIIFAALTIAAAVSEPQYASRRALSKRADPVIGPGIDVNDPLRGGKLLHRQVVPFSGAFSNALDLLLYATLASEERFDAIFTKYFNIGDKQLVLDLFGRLLDSGSGAPELANILVIGGEPSPVSVAPAEIVDYYQPRPTLIISEEAWVYPDRSDHPEQYETWATEGMDKDMYFLGSILLHEYMHWDWFLAPIHHGQIVDQDNGYGFEDARRLDKNLAIYNADSYGWFATELFWATFCGKDGGYDDPVDIF